MSDEPNNYQDATGDVARRLALYRQAVERGAAANMPAVKARLLERIRAGIDLNGRPVSTDSIPSTPSSADASLISPEEASLFEVVDRMLETIDGTSINVDDIAKMIRQEGHADRARKAKPGA